jgi:3-methyladenine DNA glycosylase/8-oxoguanine DNA glycosylase
VWRPAAPVDVRRTLSLLQHGRGDPCHQASTDGAVWRAGRLPTGTVTYRIAQRTLTEITASAWGDGAEELIAGLPRLLGAADDPTTFEPRHPLLREAHRRFPGLRVPATGQVMESLVPAVLEQKVVGLDATAAWRRLVQRYGDPAPGPGDLRVPPTATTWLSIPSWEWHRAGVDPRRARAVRVCASAATALQNAATTRPDDPSPVTARLLALPGIGRWTAAQVGHRALGDADALPIGDYHLADLAGWGLLGRALDDVEVEPFFEPWRPHRFRVVRLLELSPGVGAPRRGPRMPRQDYRRI